MSAAAPAAASTIRSIGDLPFRERPARELLGIGELARDEIDVEYTGWGWARTGPLWLASRAIPGSLRLVEDALLIALHSADDAEPMADDIELELVLDEPEASHPGGVSSSPARSRFSNEAGASVTVLLSAFLDRWLPRLPQAPAIVLALCNLHRAWLRSPPAVRDAPLLYGLGDVDAWLDPGRLGREGRLRLVADEWWRAG